MRTGHGVRYIRSTMVLSLLRLLAASFLLALCSQAQGQIEVPGPGGAFELRIQAPDAIAKLLERHM